MEPKLKSLGSPPEELVRILRKQGYHIVGRHSAVKRCNWFYQTLINGRPCYKQKFYGIKTHQCIQMTPALYYCTQHCLFCWRIQSGDLGLKWHETSMPYADEPKDIVDGCIREQLRILSGYKGNPKTDMRKFQEALTPRHAAISLAGEPTLYPRLGELISEFHSRSFTTFLVTNGTMPDVLAGLEELPTQLYVSLCAPNRRVYLRLNRPLLRDGWERLMETMRLLPSLECRKVVRITLVKGYNMDEAQIEEYARIISEAEPDFVEPKAYMWVGLSRKRLGREAMPTHSEVRAFAEKLAEKLGYNILDESPESRVVLVSKHKKKKLLS